MLPPVKSCRPVPGCARLADYEPKLLVPDAGPMGKTIRKEAIDAIFETHDHQSDVGEALYRLAFPNLDEIKSIDGWPGVGKEAGLYIIQKFMAFDRKHHPDVLNGGLWMNKGFSTHDGAAMGLGSWELSTDNCKVERLESPQATAKSTTPALVPA